MTAPTMRDVYSTVTDALADIQGLAPDRVFHGHVPDQVPEDSAGRVLPYVAVWPRVPVPVDDEPVNQVQSREGLAFLFQTTCVAADIFDQLYPMVDVVADRLTGLQVGAGVVRHESSLQSSMFLGGGEFLVDPDVSPARYFVPLRWYLTTQ
ncbi:hypothetical protein [Nesterenkonia sp. K-15-9-6]|uniref:hypothetical protein n=1 Tax=Nesterenkonia sp. K-15-9-6 TaxID=3093918 RepID=UPI004045131B